MRGGGSQPLLLSNRRPQAQVQLGDTWRAEGWAAAPTSLKGPWAPPGQGSDLMGHRWICADALLLSSAGRLRLRPLQRLVWGVACGSGRCAVCGGSGRPAEDRCPLPVPGALPAAVAAVDTCNSQPPAPRGEHGCGQGPPQPDPGRTSGGACPCIEPFPSGCPLFLRLLAGPLHSLPPKRPWTGQSPSFELVFELVRTGANPQMSSHRRHFVIAVNHPVAFQLICTYQADLRPVWGTGASPLLSGVPDLSPAEAGWVA